MRIPLPRLLRQTTRRFARDDEGAIVVEFALVLPLMILFLVVTAEGAKLMWSYQAAIAGVRDATRYASRVGDLTACGEDSLDGIEGTLKNMVAEDIDGNALFPSTITVNSVDTTVDCYESTTLRLSDTPHVTVTANMTITFPLASFLSYFNSSFSSITTNVTDKTRIFGQ